MRKLLLTSAGFENRIIEGIFLRLIDKKPEEIKALFIPTAAISPDSIAVLPKCMDDLLNTGILAQNITVFDLHRGMTFEELSAFNAIYFCGGNPSYLLSRINDTHFNIGIKKFVDSGGIYVGVSAGSMVAVNNLPNNLGFMNCTINVHVHKGYPIGEIDTTQCPHIELSDKQAILIQGDKCSVVE